MNNRHSD